MGQIEHGEYRDDCEGLDPSIIEKYYGSDENELDVDSSGDEDSGDGNSSDSDSDSGADDLQGE